MIAAAAMGHGNRFTGTAAVGQGCRARGVCFRAWGVHRAKKPSMRSGLQAMENFLQEIEKLPEIGAIAFLDRPLDYARVGGIQNVRHEMASGQGP